MAQYQTKKFKGVVMLKGYMECPDGRHYIGFAGEVSILSDKELVGFNVSGNEANWAARIEGPETSVNVLGCQIRGAYEGDKFLQQAVASSTMLVVP